MNAGRMRHPVTFQRAHSGLDGVNSPENTWSNLYEGFAAIDPAGMSESPESGQVSAIQSFVVGTRYNPDMPLKPNDRILFDDRVFEIEGIVNIDERRADQVLSCRELVTYG